MTSRNVNAIACLMVLLGVAFVLAFVPKARAHDIYKGWSPPNNPKTSCCNAQTPDNPTGDCRPTRAYLHDDGRWRAWNGAIWLIVPPDRMLPTDYAGDGRSHLCEKGEYIYCFSPGDIRS